MRPKKLYRYNIHHELETHEIQEHCDPHLQSRIHSRIHGVWRCRVIEGVHGHDHSGFATRKEAVVEEIRNVKRDLFDLTQWLDTLEGRKPGPKDKMRIE